MKRILLIVATLGLFFSTQAQPFSTACQTNIAIPDNGCVASNYAYSNNIVVSGLSTPLTGTFGVVEVNFVIEHTWDSDLNIYLEAPNGTQVELSTGNGGTGDNYGNPTGTCTPGSDVTTIRMDAATLISSGTAPFIGTYRPEGNLADFNNGTINPNGNWRLKVCDNAGLDVGQIEYARILFGTPPPPVLNYCIPTYGFG